MSPSNICRKLAKKNNISENPFLFQQMRAIEAEYGPIIEDEDSGTDTKF